MTSEAPPTPRGLHYREPPATPYKSNGTHSNAARLAATVPSALSASPHPRIKTRARPPPLKRCTCPGIPGVGLTSCRTPWQRQHLQHPPPSLLLPSRRACPAVTPASFDRGCARARGGSGLARAARPAPAGKPRACALASLSRTAGLVQGERTAPLSPLLAPPRAPLPWQRRRASSLLRC